MTVNSRTWVVIADGAQADVVQYSGGENLQAVPDGHFEQPNLPSRDIVSDDRGRSFSSNGGNNARSAMEFTTDPHEHEEFRFVSKVSSFLDQHVNDFDNLVIAAAPKALGTIRKKISSNVQKKVCAELNKDFTNIPLKDVQSQLIDVIRSHTPPQ